MADEFVRTETSNEIMRRMEATMEKNLAKHEAMIAKLEASMGRMEEQLALMNDCFDNRLKALEENFNYSLNAMNERFNSRIDSVKDRTDAKFSSLDFTLNEIKNDVKTINIKFDIVKNLSLNLAGLAIVIPVIMTIIQRIWR
ncbi:MAG: hypothetical protein II948_09840 [Synergistaceae bacterium]|nr:hypothetical protein [Synergistaceae bacterium]